MLCNGKELPQPSNNNLDSSRQCGAVLISRPSESSGETEDRSVH